MNERARIVVAGLGRIGRLHARNLDGRVGPAVLAGVVDPVEALARATGELHGVPWHTSLARALDDPHVDGVVIAAPTATHAATVELAVRAGKHVLCEKPLGFDVAAARRAHAAATRARVHLQVGFQRRFDPDLVALREALQAGELGRLHLLRISHRDICPPASALGDLFADMAVHDLDTARWLGGEVAELFALPRGGAAQAPPLGAALALRFATGALGVVDVSRDARYGFECSVELVGSRATARSGYRRLRRDVELLRDGCASALLPPHHGERHAAAYRAELAHFGELVAGRAAPRATGEDAIAALALARLARRSAEAGVPLDVDDTAPGDAGRGRRRAERSARSRAEAAR